jgi:hypothetical protein
MRLALNFDHSRFLLLFHDKQRQNDVAQKIVVVFHSLMLRVLNAALTAPASERFLRCTVSRVYSASLNLSTGLVHDSYVPLVMLLILGDDGMNDADTFSESPKHSSSFT